MLSWKIKDEVNEIIYCLNYKCDSSDSGKRELMKRVSTSILHINSLVKPVLGKWEKKQGKGETPDPFIDIDLLKEKMFFLNIVDSVNA